MPSFGNGYSVEVEYPLSPVGVAVEVPVSTGQSVSVVPVVGPPGPTGAPGGAVYTHTQSTPANPWIIPHNLGRYIEPVVFLDGQPGVPQYTDILHSSPNQTAIIFPGPVSGVAYF